MNGEFSVLMSVYKNDKAELFEEAISSITEGQTIKPAEVVLVYDGPVSDRIKEIVKKYIDYNIVVVELAENKGLGNALKEGIKKCSYDLIARMDSDDVSAPNRFEIQYSFMQNNPKVSIVGTNVFEFEDDIQKPIQCKIMPENMNEIAIRLKHRSPVSHVTVMYRKKDIESIGSYIEVKYLEDYFLWIRAVKHNLTIYNIQDNLVFVRTGESQMSRRSSQYYTHGWDYLSKYMYDNKMISIVEYVINIISIRIFLRIPPEFKKWIYKMFLREKGSNDGIR